MAVCEMSPASDTTPHTATQEFRRDYEEPNVPVLITGVVEHWPAFHKWRTHQGFQDAAGGPQVRRARAVLPTHLPTYLPTYLPYLPTYLSTCLI
jgi:hypothetical protein